MEIPPFEKKRPATPRCGGLFRESLTQSPSHRIFDIMREIAVIAFARLIVIVCQLINIKLLTNYLSIEQLGAYYFLLTVSYLANALVFIPIDYYQQANLSKMIAATGGAQALLGFNKNIAIFYILLTSFGLILGVVFVPNYVWHIILAAALAFFLYVVQALRNTLNNLGYKQFVAYSLTQEAVVKILIFLVFIKYYLPNELLVISVWLATLMSTAVVLYFKAVKIGIFNSSKTYELKTKDVFNFSYPISVAAICNWIQVQGYRLILVPLGFTEMVGMFATISNIGSTGMAAGANIFSQAYLPKIYKSSGEYTKFFLRKALALIVIVLLVCILWGDLIVRLSTNINFKPYWTLLFFGVLAEAANFIIGALAIHITLTGSTKRIMTSSVLGVITMAVAFFLIFVTNNISIYTIGIPLISSQLVVVAYMYWKFKSMKTRVCA